MHPYGLGSRVAIHGGLRPAGVLVMGMGRRTGVGLESIDTHTQAHGGRGWIL
jgi:hypothetical protein